MLKFYGLASCTTSKKAQKRLDEAKISYEWLSLDEQTPSKEVIEQLLKEAKTIKQVFNTSGKRYQELNLKDKLEDLSHEEIVNLLKENGRLIKRPVVTDGKKVTSGFRKDFDQWLN